MYSINLNAIELHSRIIEFVQNFLQHLYVSGFLNLNIQNNKRLKFDVVCLQVAVWSQFMNFEPSIPHLTPSQAAGGGVGGGGDISCRHGQQQQLLSNSGQLSDTRLSFMAPSLCVDGTSTQLLVQSFNHRPNPELDGHRSLLHFQSINETGHGILLTPRCDDEETIIEMESRSSVLSDLNASPRPSSAQLLPR